MIKMMIAAMNSNSGKTMITCGLLTLLKKRGIKPCAFKCGPDYIDPMLHRGVLGVESHNLDLFLADADRVKLLFHKYSMGYGATVCEGVMGYYDGLGGTTDHGSSWHVAHTVNLPVLLVLRPKGSSLTLAAQVKGLCAFREDHQITGILLNDCSPMLFQSLAPMLERETGIPVLGYLPYMEKMALKSRHLGLYTASEIKDLTVRLDALAEQLEKSVDLERLIDLFSFAEEPAMEERIRQKQLKTPHVRLAVANDEAFCFTYAETLDILQEAGTELISFQPLYDERLPENIDGLYLPGGYPELYAEALSQNSSMRTSIQEAIRAGLPTIAECGGLLYLCRSLQDQAGVCWSMVDVIPANGVKTEKLVRFGYADMTANTDSLLFRKGESVPMHAFHYWDTDEKGNAFTVQKPLSGRSWQGGFSGETLYAAFSHLYFAGKGELAERFVEAMEKYKKKRSV